ncbi:MAG: VCBS repeat-containing protein, partial [Holophagales bacterium]|nr:VCBS repeat-containing protein [Holophagales bacterium]
MESTVRSQPPCPSRPALRSHRLRAPIAAACTALAACLLATPAAGGEVPFGGGFEITQTFDRGRSVIAADLDGDGDLDVAGAAPGNSNEVAWWENTTGDGTSWTKRSVDLTLVSPVCVRAADLDGDGDLDLLAANLGDANPNSSKLVAYLNTLGDGTAWNPVVITDSLLTGADAIGVGDLDRDGDLDVIGGAMGGTDIYWFENTMGNGSAWMEHTISTIFNGARSIQVLDFDRDGDLDALVAGEFEDEVAWYENPGPAAIGSALFWNRTTVNPATLDGPQAACAADFDQDGDYDVAAVADGSGGNPEQVLWWRNSGDDTNFVAEVIEGDFGRAHGIHCADLDADGDIDIFAAGRTEEPSPFGAITWWENRLDEGASWVEHDVDGAFGGARNTWVADINGDGLADALGIGDNDKIIWYENLSIHRNAAFPVEEVLDADH